MESFSSDSDSRRRDAHSFSDSEAYSTIYSAPPKRRAGRTKFRETRHPVYKGVRRRNASKWVCEVREPNKKSRIWLGTFPTAEMAARAHDVAAIALRGRSACLNFADSAWRLPIPDSSTPRDIQRAAAEAAEAFRPSVDGGEAEQGMMIAESSMTMAADHGPFCIEDGLHFEMQGYLDMAEGLLIDPPPPLSPTDADDFESHGDFPLWSYSV